MTVELKSEWSVENPHSDYVAIDLERLVSLTCSQADRHMWIHINDSWTQVRMKCWESTLRLCSNRRGKTSVINLFSGRQTHVNSHQWQLNSSQNEVLRLRGNPHSDYVWIHINDSWTQVRMKCWESTLRLCSNRLGKTSVINLFSGRQTHVNSHQWQLNSSQNEVLRIHTQTM